MSTTRRDFLRASAATLAGVKRLVESDVIDSSASVIAVLTGNLLKDPSYTIGYHTGKLALDQNGESQAIAAGFANRPMRVPADKEHIKRALAI